MGFFGSNVVDKYLSKISLARTAIHKAITEAESVKNTKVLRLLRNAESGIDMVEGIVHGLLNLTEAEYANFELLSDFAEDSANRTVKGLKGEIDRKTGKPIDPTREAVKLNAYVAKMNTWAQKKTRQ